MMGKYNAVPVVESNLKRLGGSGFYSTSKKKGYETYAVDFGKKTVDGIIFQRTRVGLQVSDLSLHRLAKYISDSTGKSKTEVMKTLTARSSVIPKTHLERISIPSMVLILFAGLLFFGATQKSAMTGDAIFNMSNTSATAGIFICLIGIVFLIVSYYSKRK